jgi:ribonuclease HII
MSGRIVGIDEAGKGPVIGPLVVCGFAISREDLEDLIKLGIRDSKKLSKNKRKELSGLLSKKGECEIIMIQPEDLDKLMSKKTINEILYESYEELIDKLKPEIVYVDSPDVKPDRLKKRLEKKGIEVIAEHKADEKYPVVAAASIIAKVARDKEVEKLKKIFGDFGSGYASDGKTREFLKNYLEKNGCFPSCVRKSWKTLDRIAQKSLGDYL